MVFQSGKYGMPFAHLFKMCEGDARCQKVRQDLRNLVAT